MNKFPGEVNELKSVLILGAGISGLGAAHVLLRHGAKVLISDLKDSVQDKKEKAALTELGAEFRFGPQSEELLAGVDTQDLGAGRELDIYDLVLANRILQLFLPVILGRDASLVQDGLENAGLCLRDPLELGGGVEVLVSGRHTAHECRGLLLGLSLRVDGALDAHVRR